MYIYVYACLFLRYRAARAALAGGEAGTVLRAKAVLGGVACAALRAALDANGTSSLASTLASTLTSTLASTLNSTLASTLTLTHPKP